jgi:hypothetical protein
MSYWLPACKEYAEKMGRWTVPKKGTPEYEEVKKIMDRLASEKAPVPATPARAPAPTLRERQAKIREEAASKPAKENTNGVVFLAAPPADIPTTEAVEKPLTGLKKARAAKKAAEEAVAAGVLPPEMVPKRKPRVRKPAVPISVESDKLISF